jgi:hypothetical protein
MFRRIGESFQQWTMEFNMSKKPLLIAAVAATIALVLGSAVGAQASINGSPGSDGSFMHHTDGTAADVYRYGPSIIMNGDGTGDAWFCAPSYNGSWDDIAHKQTADYGKTWTNDTVMLQATAGSRDALSNCDPGAIKFGGYYYIGYTSTEDSRGTDNQVYVARSTSPTGPFDKWNGSGWGGNPQPFVTYTDAAFAYGAGEPSFVIVGTTLYVYYSWNGTAADGSPVTQTRVSTADPTNANWPGALTSRGVAIDKTAFAGSDSADVKYIDSLGKFVAVTTARRFGPSAYLQFWESTDGLSFHPSNIKAGYSRPYLHNAGLSGDATGHIDASSTHNFVAYAFGPIWADWDTYENPITYTNDSRPAPPRIQSVVPKNGSVTVNFSPDSTVTGWTLGYGTSSGSSTGSVALSATSGTVTGLTNGVRYYFSVKSTNSSGTSDASEEVYSTPENYVTVPIVAAATSSSLSGHAVSASYDGNPATFYSSVGHATSSGTEWVSYDFGSTQTIGRITVSPRTPYPLGAPELGRNLKIQASNDGTNWYPINYLDADYVGGTITEPLAVPVSTRYIRVYATDLAADDFSNHYLQIGEVKFETVPVTAFSSSAIAGWEPFHLIDGDQIGANSDFSSALYTSAAHTELAAIDLGETKTVTGMLLTPRPSGLGFPSSFTLQSSPDGTTWTNIAGQSYTSFPNPGNSPTAFRFGTPVSTRYVRLQATTLGADGSGNFALQLAQLQPQFNAPITASASSTTLGFPASNAVDGNPNSMYSSVAHSTASATDSLTLDLGASTAVSKLRLFPRQGYSFPSALTIQYSTDGTTWQTVPGQTYESFFNPADAANADNIQVDPLFDFRTVVSARYFKIVATALRQDNGASYYFQLIDVQVNP